MTDRRTIPPPPDYRQPPTPGRPAEAAPQPPASALSPVLEVELSRPVPDVAGQPIYVVRFVRPPGLGELVGFIDESSMDAIGRSLDALPFRPEWLIHVLASCASVPKSSGRLIAASDLLRLGVALVPFVGGGSTGATSAPSPSDMGGAPETSTG